MRQHDGAHAHALVVVLHAQGDLPKHITSMFRV